MKYDAFALLQINLEIQTAATRLVNYSSESPDRELAIALTNAVEALKVARNRTEILMQNEYDKD